MTMLMLIVAMLSLTLADPAWADLYVRQGAAGTSSGADWTNACPGFTGACAISALPRGQTVWVADGSYGSQQFSRAASGTSVITIKKATPASHGAEVGWNNTYGDGQAVFGSNIQFLTSFWVFDGSSRASLTAGHGFKIDNSASGATQLVTFGQYGGPISNVTVKYVELAGRGYGQTSVVDRCFYSNAPGTSNITLTHNYIHDVYVPILTRNLTTLLIEHNYIRDNNSTPAAHGETWSDDGSDNVIFRFNRIKNPEGTAMIAILNGGGTQSASNTASNWEIYGNVIFQQGYVPGPTNNPGIAGIVYVANDSSNRNWTDNWKFYNNTIYGFGTGTAPARIFVQSVGTGSRPIVRNNVWDSNGAGAPHLNINASHNYYRATSHPAEPNEQTGASSPFVNVGAGDFHLVAATTAGTSADNPPGNTKDVDGIPRGGDGAWDRGAYEFGSDGVPPTPPAPSPPMNPRLTLLGVFGVVVLPIITRLLWS